MTARIERVSSAEINTWLASGLVPHDGEFPDFSSQLTAIGESLLTLPAGTRVLPGRGEETTIAAAEKSFDSWAGAGLA